MRPDTRPLPLGDALSPTIARLRQMATQSYNTLLLAEGPPEPDYELLDLCSETLHAIKLANAKRAEYDAATALSNQKWTDASRAETGRLLEQWKVLDSTATRLIRRVAKLKATTAAGLYAKALICRSTATGSAVLAHSLADDFIACEGLRASLWLAGDAS